MIRESDIDANKPVVVKWDKKIVNNGAVDDGVLAGVANSFLTRIDDEAKFISLCRYMGLDSVTQDIQHLRVNSKLVNMYKLTGDNKYSQVDDLSYLWETKPTILKQVLEAHPFTAYTVISKLFLKGNIEKEKFIQDYENILAPAVAYDIDEIALFGKKTEASQDGVFAMDGVLAQLDKIHATQPNMGKYEAGVQGNEVINDLDAMLLRFTKNKGKRSEAKIFVDAGAESAIIQALGARETEGGDRLTFNDKGNVMFRGREIIHLDALDNPRGEYGANDARYLLIANPDSIIYAPLLQMESEAQYDVYKKAYITSIDVWFDVAVLYGQDALYAEFTPSA